MTPQAEQVKKSKIFTVVDAILLTVLLILCLLPLFLKPQKSSGVSVKITHGGKSTVYSLTQNRTLEIDGAVIKIEDGKVYFESNDCPTLRCVHTGKIDTAGESAICIPKGIYVEIIGSAFDGSTV